VRVECNLLQKAKHTHKQADTKTSRQKDDKRRKTIRQKMVRHFAGRVQFHDLAGGVRAATVAGCVLRSTTVRVACNKNNISNTEYADIRKKMVRHSAGGVHFHDCAGGVRAATEQAGCCGSTTLRVECMPERRGENSE
jgi:hypothetical protein